MSDTKADYSKYQDRPALVHAVRTMPPWKWKLLGFALVFGCIGVGGEAASYFLKHPQPAATVTRSVAPAPAAPGAPSGSSGFVSGQPTPAAPDATPASPPQSSTLTDVITPFMSHFGFSLFVGVIVGLVFRTFLRMAMITTALIVGGAMALSYLHVNVDLAAVKSQTSQATSWLTDQGDRLKDTLFHALPSSTAAGLGFLFGFKRR